MDLELQKVLKKKGNETCADCASKHPRWASINLGVLICMECSGFHRKMGTHISKVKSLTLDKWQPQWIQTCLKVGNELAKCYYEYQLPSNYERPSRRDSPNAIENWIRMKYERKQFAPKNSLEPWALLEKGEDPWKSVPSRNDQEGTGVRMEKKKSLKKEKGDTSADGAGSKNFENKKNDRENKNQQNQKKDTFDDPFASFIPPPGDSSKNKKVNEIDNLFSLLNVSDDFFSSSDISTLASPSAVQSSIANSFVPPLPKSGSSSLIPDVLEPDCSSSARTLTSGTDEKVAAAKAAIARLYTDPVRNNGRREKQIWDQQAHSVNSNPFAQIGNGSDNIQQHSNSIGNKNASSTNDRLTALSSSNIGSSNLSPFSSMTLTKSQDGSDIWNVLVVSDENEKKSANKKDSSMSLQSLDAFALVNSITDSNKMDNKRTNDVNTTNNFDFNRNISNNNNINFVDNNYSSDTVNATSINNNSYFSNHNTSSDNIHFKNIYMNSICLNRENIGNSNISIDLNISNNGKRDKCKKDSCLNMLSSNVTNNNSFTNEQSDIFFYEGQKKKK